MIDKVFLIKLKSLIIFLFILNSKLLFGQTLDGKSVYLDTCIYIKECNIDSLVFNEKLNKIDTFSYCKYSQKLIYRESESDTLYDIQIDDMYQGYLINGKKNGVWRLYNYYESINYYCWERLIAVENVIYFNDIKLGSEYYLNNFNISANADTLSSIIDHRIDEKSFEIELKCTKSNNGYSCILQLNDNLILNKFPLKYAYEEIGLLEMGNYNRQILKSNAH